MMYGFASIGRCLTLCCIIIGLGSLTQLSVEGFGNIFSSASFPKGKSIGELARKKIEDLHTLRRRLEKKRLEDYNNNIKLSTISEATGLYTDTDNSTNAQLTHANGNSNSEKAEQKQTKAEGNLTSSGKPIELRTVPFPGMWNSLRSVFSTKKYRDGFLSRILPKSEVLRKIIRMRNEMDPTLRDYLTSKYNNFLTKLEPFSDKIGVPLFVLNSMKISPSQDLHWYYIEKLLETSSVDDLIHSIPDFSSFTSPHLAIDSNSLNEYEPIQSRVDEDLVSDQEPEATVKSHKKKYASYGIRLGSRRNRPNKGELAVTATSTSVVGPDRTGYEYSSYADQYGVYGHDSYDTYGKGYDDYSHKGYGGSGGGGHGGGHGHKGGYDDYSYKGSSHKGSDKGHGHGGSSSSYGHSTYYTPKSYGGGYGHSGGGYGGGGGGYGHGGGGGYGGGGHGHGMMAGFLDPFSILGTLAFLTYLGLLFQQSMTPTMTNMTGRAFPHNVDPVFGRRPKSVELTVLSFDSDIAASASASASSSSSFSDTSNEHAKNRHIRSLENNLLNMDFIGSEVLEDTWKAILTIEKTADTACRHEQLCQLVQDIVDTDLMNVFKDALEKRDEDRNYLNDLYHKSTTSQGIICHMELCRF